MNPRASAPTLNHEISRPKKTSSGELQIVDSFELTKPPDSSSPLIAEVESFLDGQGTSHPFQLPKWGQNTGLWALFRRRGQLCWFAQCGVFYPAGRLLASVQALVVNRGPVAVNPECLLEGLSEFTKVAAERGFTLVDIIPEWTCDSDADITAKIRMNGWQPIGNARKSLRLDLSRDADQLMTGFRKVVRYEIRRAERLNIVVKPACTESEYEAWLGLYISMAKAKHFTAEDPNHIRRILQWLGTESGRGSLLLAHYQSKLVGGVVIVRSGARCWYVFGATVKSEQFSAGHLLQWRALQWAKDNGCREYDFGGYTQDAKTGPAFFKEGFCDNVVTFPAASRYILRPGLHGMSEIVRTSRGKLRSLIERSNRQNHFSEARPLS